MIRRKLRLCCSARYRNLLSAVFIMILLFIYMRPKSYLYYSSNQKDCDELVLTKFSSTAKKYIYLHKDDHFEIFNATELKRWTLIQNTRAEVFNLELYGSVTADTFIIVVQVHNYACDINYLIASLSEVEGIENTLIIFSHSRVDHHVNRLITSIDFCRFLQLFYPYSIQAYPDEFPGYAKNYCPPSLNMRAAEKWNCVGEMTPDIHGLYRNPINAEKKHHWWWTANEVFSGILHNHGHKGLVVFLKHNFFINSNFIYILNRMVNVAQSLQDCDFISLGSKLDVIAEENDHSIELTTWDPKFHSNILAMLPSTWESIKSHYDIFCHTDDYSWARSLFEVSINRKDGRMFKVLSSTTSSSGAILIPSTSCSPIGDMMDCNVVQNIVQLLNLQRINRDLFFPINFKVNYDIKLYDDYFLYIEYVENNGGWNDRRDQQLCRNISGNNEITNSVTKDEEPSYKNNKLIYPDQFIDYAN